MKLPLKRVGDFVIDSNNFVFFKFEYNEKIGFNDKLFDKIIDIINNEQKYVELEYNIFLIDNKIYFNGQHVITFRFYNDKMERLSLSEYEKDKIITYILLKLKTYMDFI